MGIFRIGPVYGYGDGLPSGSHGWPYHKVTDRDAWIDDDTLGFPRSQYNHLYTLPPGQPEPAWWKKEHMHLGDFAYNWLLLVEHNYDNPDPAAGNEIFFHIRRGEHYRTAGCTTMKQTDLEDLIRWLKPEANPVLVQFTLAEWTRLQSSWHLPAPPPH
jgi:L,D-peptidoglycan transpeptidase YkuD (ErfK/YbiS/YcfS/YnhG family)